MPHSLPEFSQPQHFREDQSYRVIELDGITFVGYQLAEKPDLCKVHVTENMFLFVLDGKKEIDAGSGIFLAGEQQALFLRRGSYIMDASLSLETGFYRCIVFFFDDAFLSEFSRRHDLSPSAVEKTSGNSAVFAIPVSAYLQTCVQSFLPLFDYRGTHLKRLMQLKLDEVLLSILDADTGQDFLFFLHRIVSEKKRALSRLMEESLGSQETVEELARRAGVSLSTFKREFKELFQTSPREWLNRKRLEQARFLLSHPDKNVTEISLEIGFESVSHFIQLFKNRYGVTPKQFQKSHNRQKKSRPL